MTDENQKPKLELVPPTEEELDEEETGISRAAARSSWREGRQRRRHRCHLRGQGADEERILPHPSRVPADRADRRTSRSEWRSNISP